MPGLTPMGCLFSADPGSRRARSSAAMKVFPTSLPVEVLQYICAICNDDSNGRDVRHLSLCCRYLRSVVIAYTFPVRSSRFCLKLC